MRILVSCSRPARVEPYLAALAGAGIAESERGVLTPADASRPDLDRLAAAADGLLLTGGDDIEPCRYGESPRPGIIYQHFPGRDELEAALLAGARRAATPVFGICRGLQMLNVALGGTLWHDLPSERPGDVRHSIPEPLDALAHPVRVRPGGSELHELLRAPESAGEPAVNSRHHQAIRSLAPGLEVVAVAPDGVVEAVIGSDPRWWLRAVQWHPENLQAHELHRRLFAQFVAAARARAAAEAERIDTRELVEVGSPRQGLDAFLEQRAPQRRPR